MSPSTIQAVGKSLRELARVQSKPFSVVLHGGEPLLIGIERLENLFKELRSGLSVSFPISIQTNGILITNNILDLCYRYRVSLAVSLDGPRHVNDASRRYHTGKGTFDRIMAGIEKLSSHEHADFLYAGLLAVIDTKYSPREVYTFFKSIKAPSIDFLCRDGNHSRLPDGKIAVSSTEYGSWMLRLANIYLSDSNPIEIRIIDDMIKVLLGGKETKEGLGVTNFGIAIVDTDGAITKNDTLKSSGPSADRFSKDWNINRDSLIDVLRSSEFEVYHNAQKPTDKECLDCEYLKVCGGGMLTHRWSDQSGYDNPTVYCADQIYLIQGLRSLLQEHGASLP